MTYVQPYKYTSAELASALLADLRSDLAFSVRGDPRTPEWEKYQARLRALIAAQEKRMEAPLSDAELRS